MTINESESLIKTKRIEAKVLSVSKVNGLKQTGISINGQILQLKRKIRELRSKVRELRRKMNREIEELETQNSFLQMQMNALQTEISSGIFPNPEMQSILESKIGQSVTITTAAGNITGVVIAVGTDSAEIQENTGDIVIIAYVKITSVQ